MKTSELIDLLRKLDPDGNANISMPNGVPYFIDLVDATKETPYTYFDDDENLIVSNKGMKIDIFAMDIWSFVQKNYVDGIEWDEIKKKIKFDFEYPTLEESNIKMATVIKRARESFEMVKKIHTEANSVDTTNESNNTSVGTKKKKIGLLSKKIMNK